MSKFKCKNPECGTTDPIMFYDSKKNHCKACIKEHNKLKKIPKKNLSDKIDELDNVIMGMKAIIMELKRQNDILTGDYLKLSNTVYQLSSKLNDNIDSGVIRPR
jgi:hypothetical protein